MCECNGSAELAHVTKKIIKPKFSDHEIGSGSILNYSWSFEPDSIVAWAAVERNSGNSFGDARGVSSNEEREVKEPLDKGNDGQRSVLLKERLRHTSRTLKQPSSRKIAEYEVSESSDLRFEHEADESIRPRGGRVHFATKRTTL